jgi:hypothetical protein
MSTKRWIEPDSDADDGERELLRSGLDADPPAGAERAVWASVLAAVVPPVGPGGGGSPVPDAAPPSPMPIGGSGLAAQATSATVGTFTKGLLAGAVFSVAAVTGQRALESDPVPTPVANAVASAPRAPTAALPRAPEVARRVTTASPGEGETSQATRATPASGALPAAPAPLPNDALAAGARSPIVGGSVAAFPTPGAAPDAARSRLEEETLMLRRARSELRSGALAAAFATLEASRHTFAAPELAQEREALTIELLHVSGERAVASARARAFLERFPESPHAARVRGFAAP